jgi:hypothetical protein
VFIEKASVPGYHLPRPVFQVFDTVVSIPEVSGVEVPMALKTHMITGDLKPGPALDFRHKEGTFYRKIWEEGELWLTTMLSRPFNRKGKIGLALNAQAAKALLSGLAKQTLPDGVVDDIVRNEVGENHYHAFYKKKGGGIVIPPDTEKAITRASEAFHRACDDFVLIDGELWEKCPEPVLSVDIHYRPGRLGCASVEFSPANITGGQTGRPPLTEIMFPVLAYEEARNMADQLFDPSAPWKTKDFKFDLLMPEVFSCELPFDEVIGQLVHCSQVHPDEATRARLLEFLSDPTAWTEGNIQDEVDNALAIIPEQQSWIIGAMKHQQGRFDQRAVHIPVTTMFSDVRLGTS